MEWFRERISREMDNGDDTFFWEDGWWEGSFELKLPRIFQLSLDKGESSAIWGLGKGMFGFENGDGEEIYL